MNTIVRREIGGEAEILLVERKNQTHPEILASTYYLVAMHTVPKGFSQIRRLDALSEPTARYLYEQAYQKAAVAHIATLVKEQEARS